MQDIEELPGIVEEPASVELFAFLGTRGRKGYRNLERDRFLPVQQATSVDSVIVGPKT